MGVEESLSSFSCLYMTWEAQKFCILGSSYFLSILTFRRGSGRGPGCKWSNDYLRRIWWTRPTSRSSGTGGQCQSWHESRKALGWGDCADAACETCLESWNTLLELRGALGYPGEGLVAGHSDEGDLMCCVVVSSSWSTPSSCWACC